VSGPKRVIPLPTPERVRSLVRYDGCDFYWLPRPLKFFPDERAWKSWTSRCADKKLRIKQQSNGYHGIRIDGALILIHRAVWVLHYGEWPKGEIDHINGDKFDNRIENLRDGDKAANMRNQKLRSDSTSGFPGVHFCKAKTCRPWAARVGINGTWKTLGYFATREEAIACRRREQGRFGFTERHGLPAPSTDVLVVHGERL
jgi:hypothetical protein